MEKIVKHRIINLLGYNVNIIPSDDANTLTFNDMIEDYIFRRYLNID